MSLYRIYLTPQVYREIKALPGHIRRKIKRAIADLANQPRPPQSKALNFPGTDREACRLRLDKWRVVYAVSEDEQTVSIVAVRKRPPYDYQDLLDLLAGNTAGGTES
jgi:mRNA interferase RelE/StbE